MTRSLTGPADAQQKCSLALTAPAGRPRVAATSSAQIEDEDEDENEEEMGSWRGWSALTGRYAFL